ncbi:CGNR zinc finger domain-containing protein [Nonomuraea sp. NPDC050556]|uniref:CGNR zinc finger domain-containing protein n=1 Tax=Nonomuraea sp. NPDC050556 TaxID=3364369 RepID=UPI00378A42EE
MNDAVPLTGEPLALDLVNTRPQQGDLLATPADLEAWLALEPLPPVGPLVAADLAAVHAVREHTARALGAVRQGLRPAAADLDALNQAQLAAPVLRELNWTGSALTATRTRTGPAGAQLAAWLAEAAAELLTDPGVTRIRECSADDCVMVFLPANPRRMWCSPTRCGNRARVARHYQRHRSG